MANKNKEKKNTNVIRNILFILIAVIIIAAIAVMFFKGSFANAEKETQSSIDSASVTTNASGSEMNSFDDAVDGYTDDSLTGDNTSGSETKTTEKSTAKPYTPAKNYSLPLSVSNVLDMLSDHYGSGYQVNSTVTENEYTYFAVIKNGEKYASVRVNLANGDATETIIETGQTSDFNLV